MRNIFLLIFFCSCNDINYNKIIFEKRGNNNDYRFKAYTSSDSIIRGYEIFFLGDKYNMHYFNGHSICQHINSEGKVSGVVEGNGFTYSKGGDPRVDKDGIEITYYKPYLPSDIKFNKEGLLDGVRLLLDTNGHIIERQVWKNGKRIGRGKYLQYKEIE